MMVVPDVKITTLCEEVKKEHRSEVWLKWISR